MNAILPEDYIFHLFWVLMVYGIILGILITASYRIFYRFFKHNIIKK